MQSSISQKVSYEGLRLERKPDQIKYLMVLSVRMRIQCGMGRFCLIFFASFFLILNVLCDGCNFSFGTKFKEKTNHQICKFQQRMQRSERERKRKPSSLLLRLVSRRRAKNPKIWKRRRPRVFILEKKNTRRDRSWHLAVDKPYTKRAG